MELHDFVYVLKQCVYESDVHMITLDVLLNCTFLFRRSEVRAQIVHLQVAQTDVDSIGP